MEATFTMPMLGQPLPEIKASSTHGPLSLPEDSRGKWLVLFSHPADFTPVCTTEFVAFQHRIQKFAELNAMLVGLSIDQVFSHIKWMEWIRDRLGVEIDFPVIADDRGEIARKLGMIHPGKGSNTVRAVFLADPQGTVRLMLYYPQEVGRNMDEILRALKALQISDSHGCAMPANWPHNELIEDRVIIPPACDTKAAKTRLKEYEGFDWWFCHKEI
ncbi:peroxiredoxin [Mailhella massiliensis]|uniref:Peroxiredoxin n=1 Tax=Mailhella massiliensis TaxID=1903261 RepID=A0A921AUK7_9BACT|nr:peroxiredoxin [Mailhella massiliensis]HJD96196.1 peroxiredoxin [Mailhella massiliensis]